MGGTLLLALTLVVVVLVAVPLNEHLEGQPVSWARWLSALVPLTLYLSGLTLFLVAFIRDEIDRRREHQATERNRDYKEAPPGAPVEKGRPTQKKSRYKLKLLQGVANAVCIVLIDDPDPSGIEQIAHLGEGRLTIDLLSGESRHEERPLTSLPAAEELAVWFQAQMEAVGIPFESVDEATLVVNAAIRQGQADDGRWGQMALRCESLIRVGERTFNGGPEEYVMVRRTAAPEE